MRRDSFRSSAISFLTIGVAVLASSTSLATQPTHVIWQAQGSSTVVCIAPIQDINNDGVQDIVFESYGGGGPSGVDHVFAISGASSGTGTVIWSARPIGGASSGGGWGDFCLHASPDLNGDGKQDVLLGTAWGGRTAFALNGTSGTTMWRFDTYSMSPPTPPESGWVYDMSSLGSDFTGDGVPEVVFAVGSYNEGLYCANGATGAILWYFRGPDAFDFCESIADVNNDGVRDVAALVTDNYPTVYVFSGRGNNGQPRIIWQASLTNALWSACEIPQPGGQPATVVVGCWDNMLHAYNAATGAARWTGNVGNPVERIVAVPDVNGDGIKDIAVGSWDNAGLVYSGASGARIWRTPVGTLNGGDCWSCDSVGDTNGDGIADVAFGSFDTNAYLMDGRTGAILWSRGVGDRVMSIRGTADLNGNGSPDVVAGTQWLTGYPTGGKLFCFDGNDALAGVDGGIAASKVRMEVQPNPFGGQAKWSFSLDRPAARARLEIFDPSGRLVRVVRDGPASGPTSSIWDGRADDGRAMPAGLYLGRLTADGRLIGTRRVVRLQ